MARRGSVGSIIMALARESARQQRIAVANARRAERDSIREQKRIQRERLAAEREYTRTRKQTEKELRAQYVEERIESVEDQNEEVGETLASLNSLLIDTLGKNDTVAFSSLRITDQPPLLLLPRSFTAAIPKPNEADFVRRVVKAERIRSYLAGHKKKV